MDIVRALWLIDHGQSSLVLAEVEKLLDEEEHKMKSEHRISHGYLKALDLIGEVGTKAASLAPRLQHSLSFGNPDVQFNAAWSLWRISPNSVEVQPVLSNLAAMENYELENFGSADWQRGLSEIKRKRESYHTRIAALGALWQMDEKERPGLEAATEVLLRDWEYYNDQKHSQPEEVAAVPLLTAIENDVTKAKAHEVARRAKRAILGINSERW